MTGTTKLFAVVATSVMIWLSGCASGNIRALPQIVGADTSSVWLRVSDDGTGVTLSGHVTRSIEKTLIEDYVRAELGYKVITNLITSN